MMNKRLENISQGSKKKLWIFVAVVAFLVITTMMELYLKQLNVNSQNFSSNILVFLVVNINVIILVSLGIVIIRNILKLYMERRSMVIGSKFKLKLVLTFLFVTIIPSVFLFWIASGLIYSSINNFFRFEFQRSMVQSTSIAQEYFQTAEKRAILFSGNISRLLSRLMQEEMSHEDILAELQHHSRELGLISITVFAWKSSVIYQTEMSEDDLIPVQKTSIEDLMNHVYEGESEGTVIQYGNSDIVYGMAPVDLAGEKGIVLCRIRITPSISNMTNDLNKTISKFNELQVYQDPLKLSYIITFALIFLFIVFSAIWFAMYISRGITDTIGNLLEGTKKMSTGEIGIQVEHGNDSELNILVDSFNDMTSSVKDFKSRTEIAHKELELKVHYIETLMNNVKAGIISFDTRGRLQTINQSAMDILNLSRNIDYSGKHFKKVLNKDYFVTIKELVKSFIASDEISLRDEVDIYVKNRKLHLIIQLSFLMDSSGKVYGIICVFEDVTELTTSKEIGAWRDVARSIAHEIKNPLMPIQLNTERIRKKFQQKSPDFETVFLRSSQIIIEETNRLKRMVNEFSEFARMPPVVKVKADIVTSIKQVIDLFKPAHAGIEFKMKAPEEGIECYHDPDQIKRMFINLIKNAVEALKDKGKIKINFSVTDQGKTLDIVFSDDGPGIDQAVSDRLFKPYVTTKEKGTGLGLAIVQRITHEHGGVINLIQSKQGTHFKVSLPIV